MTWQLQDVQRDATSFAPNITLSLAAGALSDRGAFVQANLSGSPSTTIDSATCNGVAMVPCTAQFNSISSNLPTRAFQLAGDANVPTGALTIVVTFSDGNGKPDIVGMCWSGGGAISGAVSDTLTSTTPSWTVATSAGEKVLALFHFDSGAGGVVTPGTGTTIELAQRPSTWVDEFALSEDATGSSQVIGVSTGTPMPSWAGTAISVAAVATAAQFAYPIADLAVAAWLPSVRNLLTYTEAFDNAVWPMLNASISANAAVAPDGNTTADKMIESGGGATTHGFERPATLATPSVDYTYSVYLKPAGRDWARLDFDNRDVDTAFAYFDLVNGVVGSNAGAGGVSYSCAIVAAANGYFRCSITMDAGAGGATANLYVTTATGDGVIVYAGDGTSGILMWGAQLEKASAADVYQSVPATTPTAPLYPQVDEPVTPNDADYIYVLAAGSTAKFTLTPLPDPSDLTNNKYHYRAMSPQSKSLQFDIYAGAVFVATRTQALTATLTTYDVTLTGAEAALIPPGYGSLQAWLTGL